MYNCFIKTKIVERWKKVHKDKNVFIYTKPFSHILLSKLSDIYFFNSCKFVSFRLHNLFGTILSLYFSFLNRINCANSVYLLLNCSVDLYLNGQFGHGISVLRIELKPS